MQVAPDPPCKKVKTNTSAAAAQLSSGLWGAASALREPGTCHPENVLTFWFGKDYQQRCGSRAYLEETFPLWINQSLFFDIAQRDAKCFIDHVAHGDLKGDWNEPRGVLAQIILLDQFVRCVFRGSAEAFEFDARACQLAQKAVDKGWYDLYLPVEKFWVTVALSHSEVFSENEMHFKLATRICQGASDGSVTPEVAEYFRTLPGYPHEHFDCIKRFSRFPHRNAILGRSSTEEELKWLSSEEAPGWARSQGKAKFHYWNGRGLGDQVRFLLEFTLIPYEEIDIETPDAFTKLKATGKLAFGQVPLLEIDGIELVQTQAILHYIARKKGIAGSTNKEEALADMVLNAIMDARMPLITSQFQADPKVALDKFAATTLPKCCGNIEQIIKSHGGTFIVGAKITYVDVLLYELLVYAAEALASTPELLLAGFPNMLCQFQGMQAFDHLRDYVGSVRRKPLPDEKFVRQVSSMVGMPLPKYLQEASL